VIYLLVVRGLAAFLVVVCAVAPGCGYKLVRYGGALGGVDSMAIETLENESYDPGIEYVVSDALRREFLRRGAVRLTEDARGADLVLSGSVLPVEILGPSFSSVVLILEYEVTLTLVVRATRRDGSELPIGDEALRESERYLASADVEATRKNRDEALRRVAGVLAGRVHDALAEVLAQ
jgi:hypothetical protein